MKNDRLHKMDFDGHTVWLLIARPAVFDSKSNQYVEDGYISAFKIGEEPKMLDGEYVKENGKVKFFPDHNAALCAALDEARKRIHSQA